MYDRDDAEYLKMLDALDLCEWQEIIVNSHFFKAQEEMRHMADTIDRLEAALENALNERDALLEDVKMTDILCETCAHCGANADSCDAVKYDCLCCTVACECKTCEGKHNYIWRGVPDKED